MTGGLGNDTFEFYLGSGTITDFEATNDLEQLSLRNTDVVDFADLLADHMTQVGDDVAISFTTQSLLGGPIGLTNTVVLLDVNINDLGADDFLFS